MIVPALVLAGAFAIDWFAGEPPAALHPVVWMGRVAAAAERVLFQRGSIWQLLAGLLVAAAVPAAFALAAAGIVSLTTAWPALNLLVAAVLLKTTFALRALDRAAAEVQRALGQGDLRAGRRGLQSLCSRDPAALGAPALVAATIESVAENASDSFVGPLFYYALFGIPGAVFYRAVNTLDAMIGYHGRYEYFGKAAARFDDLLNFVPARLTAALLLLSGAIRGHDIARGARTMLRDHARTESPNAGWPMAAMAGLLGVELAKAGHYTLGVPTVALQPEQIAAARRVVNAAGLMALLATGLVVLSRGAHGG